MEDLLGRYRDHRLGERGLAEGTVRGHVDVARPCIAAACVVT
jgi:hypothetical protein